MHRFRTFARALAVTALGFAASPAPGQPLNALTPDEQAAGWKLLFDGASNDGWVKPDGTAGTWTLEENALRSAGGDICTEGEYENFEFVTDYKYEAGGNSGIFIRTRKGVNPPYRSGIEIAIQDNEKAGNLCLTCDAAVYGVKAPSVDRWTGPDQWNTQRIRVEGTRLAITHNGTPVVDIDMASLEWKEAVAKSKFGDGTWPNWGKEGKGQICLQDHGYKVQFRNIKVLTLAPGSAARKPAPASGFRWDILGQGSGRRLMVAAPGSRDLEVSLLDVHGRDSGSLRARGSRAELPLGRLPPGIYWLRVVTPEFQAESRVVLF